MMGKMWGAMSVNAGCQEPVEGCSSYFVQFFLYAGPFLFIDSGSFLQVMDEECLFLRGKMGKTDSANG